MRVFVDGHRGYVGAGLAREWTISRGIDESAVDRARNGLILEHCEEVRLVRRATLSEPLDAGCLELNQLRLVAGAR